MAKRYRRAPSEGKPLEQGSFLHEKVGVGEAQQFGAYQQKDSKVTQVEVEGLESLLGPAQKRNRRSCRTSKGLSLKATRRRMIWQKQEQRWTKGLWRKRETETMQQEREEVHAALQCAASFYCLVEEWKDCEELNPRPKKKWIFVEPGKRGDETSK